MSFAVGTPLRVRVRADEGGEADWTPLPWTHITCLMRVSLRARRGGGGGANVSCVRRGQRKGEKDGGLYAKHSGSSATERRAVVVGNETNTAAPARRMSGLSAMLGRAERACDVTTEPWMLGHALDPLVPLRARTVGEHAGGGRMHVEPARVKTMTDSSKETIPVDTCYHNNNNDTNMDKDRNNNNNNIPNVNDGDNNSRQSIGGEADVDPLLVDDEAETYLIPQRELLLRLYVPPHVEAMCAQQNRQRVRTSPSPAYHHTAQRPTSARLAEAQWRHMTSAAAGAQATGATTRRAERRGWRTHYEVRALPGDVTFIPRGWGLEVRRVKGTAFIQQTWPSSPASLPEAAARGCMQVSLVHHGSSDVTVSRVYVTTRASHDESNGETRERGEWGQAGRRQTPRRRRLV